MGFIRNFSGHADRVNERNFSYANISNDKAQVQQQQAAAQRRDAAFLKLENQLASVPSEAYHLNNFGQFPGDLKLIRAAYAACLFDQGTAALHQLANISNAHLVTQFLADNPLSLALMHRAYDSVRMLLDLFPRQWDPLDRRSFHGVSINDALATAPEAIVALVRGRLKAVALQVQAKGLAQNYLAVRYNTRPAFLNGGAIHPDLPRGALLTACFNYLMPQADALRAFGLFIPLRECALLEYLIHVEDRQLDPSLEGVEVQEYLPFILRHAQADYHKKLLFEPLVSTMRLRGPYRPEMLAYYQALGPTYAPTVAFLKHTNAEWATGFAGGFHQAPHLRASHPQNHPNMAYCHPDFVPADWDVQCQRPWAETPQVPDKAQYTKQIQAWWFDFQKAQVNQQVDIRAHLGQYQAGIRAAYQAQAQQRAAEALNLREAIEADYAQTLVAIDHQHAANQEAISRQLDQATRQMERGMALSFATLMAAAVAGPISQSFGFTAGSLGAQVIRIGLNLSTRALINQSTEDLDKQLLAAILSAGLQTYCLGTPSASWTLTDYYSARVMELGPQLIVLEQDLSRDRLTQLLLSGGLDSLSQQFIEAHPNAPVLGPALSQALSSTVSQALLHKGASGLEAHFSDTLVESSLSQSFQVAGNRSSQEQRARKRVAAEVDAQALDALILSLHDDERPTPPKAASSTSAQALHAQQVPSSLSRNVGITATTLFDRDLDTDPLGLGTQTNLPSTTHKPQLEYFSEHKMMPAGVRRVQARTPNAHQTGHEKSNFHQTPDTLDPRFYEFAQRLHVEDQIARGAFRSHLPEATLLQKLSAQLPLLSFEQLNFTVGMSDGLSFGLGGFILSKTSLSSVVDRESLAYQKGRALGPFVNIGVAGATRLATSLLMQSSTQLSVETLSARLADLSQFFMPGLESVPSLSGMGGQAITTVAAINPTMATVGAGALALNSPSMLNLYKDKQRSQGESDHEPRYRRKKQNSSSESTQSTSEPKGDKPKEGKPQQMPSRVERVVGGERPLHNQKQFERSELLSQKDYLEPVKLSDESLKSIESWQYARDRALKALKSLDTTKLDDTSADYIRRTINQLKNAMTPGDLAGICKELEGARILKSHGVPYDHVNKWIQAQQTFMNTFRSKEINRILQDPGTKRQVIENFLSEASQAWDAYKTAIGEENCRIIRSQMLSLERP